MNQPFHQRLRKLRESQGLSQSELAQLIGVAKTTYSDWENGKGLKILPYQKMSQVLAISVTELISGEKPMLQEQLDELARIEECLRQVRLKLGSAT